MRAGMRRRPEISYANVTATVALVAALAGGTAYGLAGRNSVDSGDIRNGHVKASDLAKPKTVRIRENPLTASDPCVARRTAVLCGNDSISGLRGWRSVGGAYARPTATVDGFGRVFLQGAVNEAVPITTASGIFILPRAFRPARVHEFAVPREQAGDTCQGNGTTQCDFQAGTLQVQPDGDVYLLRGYASEGITLDGVTFPAR